MFQYYRSKRYLILLFIWSIATIELSGQWTVDQIPSLNEEEVSGFFGPIIQENNIVWVAETDTRHIYLFDGSTTTNISVLDENTSRSNVYPQIDGLNIVWQGYDGQNNHIYLYESGDVTKISGLNGHKAIRNSIPQISGNKVVWEGFITSSTDEHIFSYDGTNITNVSAQNQNNNLSPEINGNTIVWVGNDDQRQKHIFSFEDEKFTNVSIQDGNISTNNTSPKTNGNVIIWVGNVDNTSHIFKYDGEKVTNISSLDGNTSKSNTQPQIDGENIVWSGQDETLTKHIFFYDGNSITKVSAIGENTSTTNIQPQIDGQSIVWSGEDENRVRHIYHFKENIITKLSVQDKNSSIRNSYPQIDKNNVVWLGWEDNTAHIYQAKISPNKLTIFDANPHFFSADILDSGETDDIRNITEVGDLNTSVLIERDVIACDGVSEVLFKVPVESKDVLVEWDIGGSKFGKIEKPWTSEVIEIDDQYFVYALYTPPSSLSQLNPVKNKNNILSAVIPIDISYKHNDKLIKNIFNIELIAPPVVLIHGTFDNPDNCWKTPLQGEKSMYTSLSEEGYKVFTLDYTSTNGSQLGPCPSESFLFGSAARISSFECNRRVLYDNPGGVKEALDYYRNDLNVASTQVDVIGHSMGGVLARVYASDDSRFDRYNTGSYYRDDNFQEGDINRLITIASTHGGSDLSEFQSFFNQTWRDSDLPLSERLANTTLSHGLWFAGGIAESGAVRDQIPFSPALRRIGPTQVPSHAIVCTVDKIDDFENNIGDENNFYSYANFIKAATAYFYFFPGTLQKYLYHRIRNYKRLSSNFQNTNQYNSPIDPLSTSMVISSSKPKNLKILEESISEGFAEFWQDWHILQENADENVDWVEDKDRYELDYRTAEYNHYEADDDFDNFVRARSYDIITGETPYDDALEKSSNKAADYLRYLIFKNDLNDGVVRLESQTGRLSEPYISRFDNHIHSYAPRYKKVIDRVHSLLGSFDEEFNMEGFPAAGGRLAESIPDPAYIKPSDKSLKNRERYGCAAKCWSGMVQSHAEAFMQVALEEDVVILSRPVNPDATPLIAMDAATKGMNLKGKSSNWGPQKGYIPVDQRYSKLWNLYEDDFIKRDTQIVKFTKKTTTQLLESPDEVTRKLLEKSYTCEGELQTYDVYFDSDVADAEESVFLVQNEGNGYSVTQWLSNDLELCPSNQPTFYPEIAHLQPMYVMSKPLGTDTLFYTADYDLLAIGFKQEGLAGYEDDPYDIPTLTDFNDTKGYITSDQENLLDRLNVTVQSKGYMGGDVSHHGPENQFYNLEKPEDGSPYVDYPIIAFYQEYGVAIIHAIPKGPENFRDRPLKIFMAEKRREGYNLYENIHSPGWSWDHHGRYTYEKGWDDKDDPNLQDSPKELPFPDECSCEENKKQALIPESVLSEELVGVTNQSPPFDFQAYPNPTSDFIMVSIESLSYKEVNYKITNELGQIFQFDQFSLEGGHNEVKIDLKHIPNGAYHLTINVDEKISSQLIHINK